MTRTPTRTPALTVQVWERRRDLASSGMAELGGALEMEALGLGLGLGLYG